MPLVGLIHFKHLAYLIDSDVATPMCQMVYAHAFSFRFRRKTIEFYLYDPRVIIISYLSRRPGLSLPDGK